MTFIQAVLTSVMGLLVAAILGGLIVYFWLRNRITKLSGALQDIEKRYDALNQEAARTQKKLREEIQEKEEALSVCKEQSELLGQKYENKEAAYAQVQQQLKEQSQEVAEARNYINTLIGQSEQYKKEAKAEKEAFLARIHALEEKMNTIPTEVLEAAADERPGSSKREAALAKIREKARSFDYSNMGAARPEEREDLKLISGIGPFIEEKLNALEIYTFEQIARFNEKDIAQVTEAIEFFPGRIQRDHWIDQAKERVKEKEKAKNRV